MMDKTMYMMEKMYHDQRNKLEALIAIANESELERHKKMVALQEFYMLGFLDCMKFNISREKYELFENGYVTTTKLKNW